MALEPLSIKNMEEKTQDIYEAVVIMSKRAKQILSDRVVDEMISSAEEEIEMGVYDQVVEKTPEDFEELVFEDEDGESASMEHFLELIIDEKDE